MNWFIEAVTKNYANFNGRARRKEYWMFILINFIIGAIIGTISSFLELSILGSIYTIAVLLPTLAVSVRRFHDIDKSGWWALLNYVPIIGWIALIVFFTKPGTEGSNKYGADPKAGTEKTENFF